MEVMEINVNLDTYGMDLIALIIQIVVLKVVNGLVELAKDLGNVELGITALDLVAYLSLNNAHLHQLLMDQNVLQEVDALKEHSSKAQTVCQFNHAKMDLFGIQSILDVYAPQVQ